jgi:hypothetical protein
LKLEKARENVRRTQREKETERHETMMHDILVSDQHRHDSRCSTDLRFVLVRCPKGQTMADERRQNEMRRRIDKMQQSRQLYETLQARNHELYVCRTHCLLLTTMSYESHTMFFAFA